MRERERESERESERERERERELLSSDAHTVRYLCICAGKHNIFNFVKHSSKNKIVKMYIYLHCKEIALDVF